MRVPRIETQRAFVVLTAAKITQVVVGPDSVSASFRGLVHDPDRLRRTIDLLRRIAR